MKTNKNKFVPKVTLILNGNEKEVRLHLSIRKTQKFLKTKAKSFLKNDSTITFKVTYGYQINVFGHRTLITNSGTYKTVDELEWAFQAFVKEYLKYYEP
jgi:hypothetical protein